MIPQLPESIYFDSGILIGAAIAGSNHAAATIEFCRHVAANGCHVYFSQIALYELAHLAWCLGNPHDRRQLPREIVQQYSLDQWNDNFLVRQRWINSVGRELERLLAQFREAFEVPIRPQYWQDALNIMAYYNLRSYDALHLATAQSLQIHDIATCDHHFTDIDGINTILVRDGQ